jgi:copper chaperone CopZ
MDLQRASTTEWTRIRTDEVFEEDVERGLMDRNEEETEMVPLIHSPSPSSSSHSDRSSSGKEKVEVRVLGMTCAACSNSVEKAVLRLNGALSASVSLLQNKAIVEYDPARVKVKQILLISDSKLQSFSGSFLMICIASIHSSVCFF